MDCADVALVARFWAMALGGEVVGGAPVVLRVGAVCMAFRRAPEGKYVRNRVRLDLVTHDFELEAARLLSLGAVRLVDGLRGERRRTTFADVEGNEFDLIDGGI